MHPQDTIPCARCGTGFTAFPYELRAGRRYCSRACAYAARVRPPLEPRFWAKVARGEGANACWLWTGWTDRNGYGGFSAVLHGKADCYKTHRVAWELATGDTLTDADTICHTCDRTACVRNDAQGVYTVGGIDYPRMGHLVRATLPANNLDMALKGRWAIGEAHGNAKLTGVQVDAIRAEYAAGGVLQRDLAARFGVSVPTISEIVNLHKWKHRCP